MGKRELIIIVAFALVGGLAYQFTAPPVTGQRFSFADFFTRARTEMRGNPGKGKFVHKASVPVPAGLREVRIIGVSESVKVIGDSRGTIDYEFTVTSNGPDDAAAEGYAKESVLERDDLGDSLVLRAKYPQPAQQRSTVLVHVPSRLAVRVESSQGVNVAGVAAVHLEAIRNTVTLTDVAGAVTGAQQDGDFTLTGAKSVKLRLLRSKNRISKVLGGLTLDLRDADIEITESGGPLEVDQIRTELSVTAHNGPVTIRGNDGRVSVRRPIGETRVDMRRAEIELVVDRGVPMTAITSDEPLRLILTGLPTFGLDASTTDAAIQAGEFELKPEIAEGDARLSHQFGGKSDVRIVLRNTRGDIILRKNKESAEKK